MIPKYILLLLIIFCTPFALAAIDVTIDVDNEYTFNDTVSFNYSIVATEPTNATYYTAIYCNKSPLPQIVPVTMTLNQTPFQSYVTGFNVTDDIETQTCAAMIEFIDDNNITIIKYFNVSTIKHFSLEFNITNYLFLSNQSTTINYISDTQALNTTLYIHHPNGTITSRSTFPYLFNPNSSGIYHINVTADKPEYKQKTISTNITVEEQLQTTLEPAFNCDNDGFCDLDENITDCPSDCKQYENISVPEFNTESYILMTLIVIVSLVLIRKQKTTT
jgi:hypothetical protein